MMVLVHLLLRKPFSQNLFISAILSNLSCLRSCLADEMSRLSVITLVAMFCNFSRILREVTPHDHQAEQPDLK